MATSRRTTKLPLGKATKTPQQGATPPRITPAGAQGARPAGPPRTTPSPAPAGEPLLDGPVLEDARPAPATTEAHKPASGKTPIKRGAQSGTRGASGTTLPVSGRIGESKSHLAPAAPSGREGAEIGSLQRRGWSLTMKFSVFTLLIVILITMLFGYVSIQSLKNSVLEEILRSGHQQVLTLQQFGVRVFNNLNILKIEALREEYRDPVCREVANEIVRELETGGDPAAVTARYSVTDPTKADWSRRLIKRLEEGGATFQNLPEQYPQRFNRDVLALKAIVEAEPRVKDIAFFHQLYAGRPLFRAVREAKDFKDLPESGLIRIDNQHQDVKIYWGAYGGQSCLYFRLDMHDPGAKSYGSTNLILSAAAINEKVSGLQTTLVVFGIIFILLGLMISRLLATLMTKPINVLVDDINTVAKGELDHESTVPNITKDEIGLLAMAFNRMIKNLRDAREQEREMQRLSSEVNTAKAIHQRLLPEKILNVPNLEIGLEYRCAKEVGGDYYDFIPVGDAEHIAFCVADVSGKGIPGSMVMGTTRTYLRMMAVNNYSAADVLARTNFWVQRDMKRGMFVTCIYAILNLRTRELTVASAGHNPMLIWRAADNTIQKVRPNGIALGFDKGPIFNRTIREEKLKINVGDRIVMYTDGVVESMNEAREEWTDERLDQFTLAHAQLHSKEYVRLLIKALMEHQGKAEQHDDITVVTFRMLS